MTSRKRLSRRTQQARCKHGNVRRFCVGCGWEEVHERFKDWLDTQDEHGCKIGDELLGEASDTDGIRGAASGG